MKTFNVGLVKKKQILDDLYECKEMNMESYVLYDAINVLKNFDNDNGTDLILDVWDYYTKTKGFPFNNVDIDSHEAYPVIFTFPSGKKFAEYDMSESNIQKLMDLIISRVNRKLK